MYSILYNYIFYNFNMCTFYFNVTFSLTLFLWIIHLLAPKLFLKMYTLCTLFGNDVNIFIFKNKRKIHFSQNICCETLRLKIFVIRIKEKYIYINNKIVRNGKKIFTISSSYGQNRLHDKISEHQHSLIV